MSSAPSSPNTQDSPLRRASSERLLSRPGILRAAGILCTSGALVSLLLVEGLNLSGLQAGTSAVFVPRGPAPKEASVTAASLAEADGAGAVHVEVGQTSVSLATAQGHHAGSATVADGDSDEGTGVHGSNRSAAELGAAIATPNRTGLGGGDLSHAFVRCGAQRRKKQQVVFVHLWKTGGTNLVSMALRNNETIYHHSSAAPWGDRDWEGVLRSKCSFLEIPAPMLPAMPLGAARSGDAWAPLFLVLLRDPLKQAVSQFVHHHVAARASARSLDDAVSKLLAWLRPSARHRAGAVMDGQNFVDNVQTRWVCGHSCTGQGSNWEVTADDAARAAARLELFDIVLLAEDFDVAGKMALSALGWGDLLSRASTGLPLEGTHNSVQVDRLLERPEVVRAVRDVQDPDLRLYARARQVSAASVAAAAGCSGARAAWTGKSPKARYNNRGGWTKGC